MKLVLRLRMNEADSGSECSDPGDALEVMEAVSAQVDALGPAIADVARRIEAVAKRIDAAAAERPFADTVSVPRSSAVQAWCEAHDVEWATVTPRIFMRRLLETAVATDLAARSIRLAPDTATALGFPETVSVFQVIRQIPELLR